MLPPNRGEDGAGLVEYALLLALIAIVCVGALTFTGGRTSAKLSVLGESLVRDDEGTTTTTSGAATTTTAPVVTTTTPPVVTTVPVVTSTTAPVVTTVPATPTTLPGCGGPNPPKKCTGG